MLAGMFAISAVMIGTVVLFPSILISLSERVALKRRLIWAACSLLPLAFSLLTMLTGAYNPHGDVGPFVVFFVGIIGPWIVFLAFQKFGRGHAS